MSYNFSFNITNHFSEDITISGDFNGTVPHESTKSFEHTQSGGICDIYLNLPETKNVFDPTSTSIAITGGTYRLSVENPEDPEHGNAFKLKITNSSNSTTNVSIGDNQ